MKQFHHWDETIHLISLISKKKMEEKIPSEGQGVSWATASLPPMAAQHDEKPEVRKQDTNPESF